MVDVERQNLDTVAARVLHQLAGAIKAQGLAVEHGSQKASGFMALEPAAHVHQQRKTGGVALRKAVFAKAFDLLKKAIGKLLRVAIGHHRAHQSIVKMLHAALAFPGSHGAAQAVGLAAAEIGRRHGDLHHLLLKNRHAQGAFEHLFQRRAGVAHCLRVGACLQIGMHHATLDRPRSHDGHLHHQVVKTAGLEARQHAHLRAALDLKHAHRVGLAHHVVGGRVFGRNVLHAQGHATPPAHQVKAAVNSAEHAQRQHIHFQQTHRIQVVLVPLNDAALRHGRVFHRHEAGQRPLGEHKAPHMLAQVARMALQLRSQVQPKLQAA